MEFLQEVLSYPFALRALIVGLLVTLCAALLGVSLVLKRFSMLGDGLSHTAFGASAIALAIGAAPIKIAIPVVVLTAFLLIRLNERGKIKGDAAIAIISSSALSFGIIIATLTTGMNTDINNYMFGSILAMSKSDVYIAVIAAAIVLILYLLFYNKIFACTFDPAFASATGVHARLYDSLLAVLTAITVVVGMRMMGALLISSIITFPALSSMRLCRRYRSVMLCSAAVACVCFVLGLMLSFWFDMPTGASVVIANLAVFLIFSAISTLRNRT